MIRIAEKPQQLSFSRNPIVFKVNNESNGNLIVSAGAQSTLTISLSSPTGPQTPNIFQDGQILTLTFTNPSGQTIAQGFTFKNNPSGVEIGVGQTLEAILNVIKSHHRLAPFINFRGIDEIDQYLFIAEIKTIEPNWTINWSLNPTAQGISVSATPLSIVPDVDASVQVFFEKRFNAADWKQTFEGTIFISHDFGYTFSNYTDIIDSECILSIPENPFIHYSRTNTTISNNIRRYYAVFSHSNQLISDEIRYVMIGGTPNRVWLSNQLLQNITLNTAFLTWQPDLKTIPMSGVEYITWFNYTGETQTVSLFVKSYDASNANAESIVNSSTITVASGLCATFPIHPSAVLVNPSAFTHYKYKVKTAQNAPVSPTRTLIIDRSRPFKALAYINAFGVPEIVNCTGNLTTRMTISAETWTSIRNVQSGVSILKNERLIANIAKKYTYRSGYLNQKQKEAYTEVALSYRIFDITTPQYFGLTLLESKVDEIISDNGEKIYAWEWQTQPIISENSFAPDEYERNTGSLAEPPAFPQGIGTSTGISTGLKSFEITEAEFLALEATEQLQEGIYLLIDTTPLEVWFSGGGNAAVDITFGPLRYVKVESLTSDSVSLPGITASTAEERKRMRFYRGNAAIFLDDDITIGSNDVITFFLSFTNETFRAFY